MTTIRRTKITTEEVEIAKGYKICDYCEGKGRMSKYDQGWSSLVYSPELDAPELCMACGGDGCVPDYTHPIWTD